MIGTQVVEGLTWKFGVESLALTETCSDTNFHVYWYYGYWGTRLQEEEEKEEENMGKTFLGIMFTFGAFLLRFLVYGLVFTY